MATNIHLTSSAVNSSYDLNSCDGHLLVVRKNSVWTDKELVLTPSEECFTAAVVYAKASSYTVSVGAEVVADAQALAARYEALWNTKTTNDAWVSGHKPLFVYYARGGGPYSNRVMTDSQLQEFVFQNYEYGGDRVLLKFDAYCLPVGNLTSFRAYVRFWNPSFTYTMSPIQGAALRYSNCVSVGHNKSGYYRIRFDAEKQPPVKFNESGYFEFDMSPHANEGKGDSSLNGNEQYAKLYDVWDRLSAASSTGITGSYLRNAIYFKGYDDTEGQRNVGNYHYDYEITGESLTRLRSLLGAKSFYMMVGTLPVNGLTKDSSAGVHANCCITGYTSRIELVFRGTGPKINC